MLTLALLAGVWAATIAVLARTHPETLSPEARAAGIFVAILAIVALTVLAMVGVILGW